MKNPLNDKEFLYTLDKQKNHTTYIKILALDKNERPLQQIEGRATGGSVNVDGTSSVRRTCSLTLVSELKDIIDAYWALKNKFKLELGLKNETNQYPDYPIIWFKMGTFGINAFSKNITTTGITLNISGQDKMCFLNGTLGGSLTASTNFGEEEFINQDGSITLKKIPLKDIITKAIHTYANEPMHNIIIRDLDDVGYELWDFKGGSNEAMYVFYTTKDEDSKAYDQIFNTTFMGNMKVTLINEKTTKDMLLSEITNELLYNRNKISDNDGAIFALGKTETESGVNVKISKVLYGEAAGYYKTPLIYAGDLILNAGSPLTQLLDNIKNMLGEYEYFYDVDGHFIFQKKKTYVQGLINFDGSLPITSLPEYSYKFEDEELMTSILITPTISDVRNDLAVWGNKKSITGATLSPYGRVAIQAKPTKYVAFDGSVYSTEENKTIIKNSPMLNSIISADEYILLDDVYLDEYTGIEVEFAYLGKEDPIYQDMLDEYTVLKDRTSGAILGCGNEKEDNPFVLTIDHNNIDRNKAILKLTYSITNEDNSQVKNTIILKDNIVPDDENTLVFKWSPTTTSKKYSYQINKEPPVEIENGPLKINTNNYPLSIFGHYYTSYQGYPAPYNYNPFIKLHRVKLWKLDNEGKELIIGEYIPYMENDNITLWNITKGKTYNAHLDHKNRELLNLMPEYKNDLQIKNLDWRELIYQMAKDYMEHHDEYNFEVRLAANNAPMFSIGRTGYEQYYTDMLGFWRLLYWLWGLDKPAAANFNPSDYLPSGWHVNKEYSPESLLFWFDLLEPNGGLNPYAIETIGDRTKVDSNKSATSLYIKETPNILFAIRGKDNSSTTGELDLTPINISQSIADNVFSISTQGKSVLDALDELIYKHVLLAEGINLSLIPIYHIEPNTRIYLKNTDSDYIVTLISIPLAYNGTMSITATKVIPYIN